MTVRRSKPATLTSSFSSLVAFSVALTGWAALAAVLHAFANDGPGALAQRELVAAVAGVIAVGLFALQLRRLLLRSDEFLGNLALRQSQRIDSISASLLPICIVGYAAVSLHLELAVIRWQSSAISILAFYKNYSLISAFAGLGIGYALARRRHIPLFMVIPLLGVQLATFWTLNTARFSATLQAIRINPFSEQATMGVGRATGIGDLLAIYLTLGAVFLATSLAFLPIGQVVGRMMARTSNLRAYSLNLVGSIVGVASMYLLSALWTPPAIWFAIGFVALIPLMIYDRKAAAISALLTAGFVFLLAQPPQPDTTSIYSPYQLLEQETLASGDLNIRSAGHFLLTATDLGTEATQRSNARADYALFYEFPFRVSERLDRVLIVGSGAGNDVAAALRRESKQVVAVEIDPAIMEIGTTRHPERPFDDDRVESVVDDARSFFERTDDKYDLIVYGLLDSHSVVSHGSSVRMDSYVYTIEGLRTARSRLSDDGVLSLSFFAFTDELASKLFLMLAEAFDGAEPTVIRVGPQTLIFLIGSEGPPEVEASIFTAEDFADVTSEIAELDLAVDLATDDWPFLYMPRRVYPSSYLGMVGLVLGLGALLIRSFFKEGFDVGDAAFFFLGAGFLLVETKGITELGLAFGNTWGVVGLVIIAVLFMGYLANLLVTQWPGIPMPLVVGLLLASVGGGYLLSLIGVTATTGSGKWLSLGILTLPVFFSGLAFSLGLRSAPSVSGVLAANIAGAIVGGLVEYNSLFLGLRSLYIAAGLTFAIGGALLLRQPSVPIIPRASAGQSLASSGQAETGRSKTYDR